MPKPTSPNASAPVASPALQQSAMAFASNTNPFAATVFAPQSPPTSRLPETPRSLNDRYSNAKNGTLPDISGKIPTRLSVEKFSPGETTSRGSTIAKITELNAKISDIDNDLLRRKERQVDRAKEREAVKVNISSIHTAVTDVDYRLNHTDDRISRLETLLLAEKEGRDSMERSLLKLMEDKMKAMMMRFDLETSERERDVTDLRKRVFSLEEVVQKLLTELEEAKKNHMNLQSYVNRLSERITSTQAAVQTERVKREEDLSSSVKAINATLCTVQSLVDVEKLTRERDVEKLKGSLAREADELRRKMEADKRELECRDTSLLAPLLADIKSLAVELDQERRAREANDTLGTQKAGELVEDLKGALDRDAKVRRDDLATKFKSVDDRLSKLQYGIDREKETRDRTVRQVLDDLARETSAREDADAKFADLLDHTVNKFHLGLAAPPTTSPSVPLPIKAPPAKS